MNNMSFTNVSNQLELLGIHNNKFFLELIDESLKNVDPHSPMLSDSAKIRIVRECLVNPWYYLGEVSRIPLMGGFKDCTPYTLHRANLAATWCFLNGIDFYLTIPRCNYATNSILAILNWAFNFGLMCSQFLLFDKTPADAQLHMSRVNQQKSLLPDFMSEYLSNTRATDYSRNVSNKSNGNSLDIKGGPKSFEKADLLGRSLAHQIQFFNECEFTPFIDTILSSSAPTTHMSRAFVRRRGSIGCKIMSSIPGRPETNEARACKKIIDRCAPWSEKLYDMDRSDVDSYIMKNSCNNMVYIEYPYQMLGRDEKWFEAECRNMNNDWENINRELLLKRG